MARCPPQGAHPVHPLCHRLCPRHYSRPHSQDGGGLQRAEESRDKCAPPGDIETRRFAVGGGQTAAFIAPGGTKAGRDLPRGFHPLLGSHHAPHHPPSPCTPQHPQHPPCTQTGTTGRGGAQSEAKDSWGPPRPGTPGPCHPVPSCTQTPLTGETGRGAPRRGDWGGGHRAARACAPSPGHEAAGPLSPALCLAICSPRDPRSAVP